MAWHTQPAPWQTLAPYNAKSRNPLQGPRKSQKKTPFPKNPLRQVSGPATPDASKPRYNFLAEISSQDPFAFPRALHRIPTAALA
jgi:hypothetical protein